MPGDRSSSTRPRRTTPLVATVVLATGLVATLVAGCASSGTTYAPGVVIGSCRGFATRGGEARDPRLALRAATTWAGTGGAFGQSTPIAPPVGPVCLVNAHTADGRRVVTMADASHQATYEEPTSGEAGTVVSSAPFAAASPLPLPVISVGDGVWQLSASVTSAAVWVGAPGMAGVRTAIRAGQPLVPVDELVDDFAHRHPGVLPHLVVVMRTSNGLFAASGGAPFAASTDSVFASSLATTAGSIDVGLQAYDRLLESPSGVPLLAEAVAITYAGAQEPQHVTRILTVVGRVVSPVVGPVLVVGDEPADGRHHGPSVVNVVQLSRRGADTRPIGTVLYPTGGWAGETWLEPVASRDPDPRELLVVGHPAQPTDPPLTLFVTGPSASLRLSGPVVLVAASQVDTAPASTDRPHVRVVGHTSDGYLVLPLAGLS